MNVFTFTGRTLRNKKAFTLVEIMIVLAILGSIFALLAPKFGGARDKANQKEAKIQMGMIANALSDYNLDCAKYPKTLEGLTKPDPDCANWGPDAYYKKSLKDPWKNDYVYELNGSEFTIKSLGKDGKEGGSGFNKDIPGDEDANAGDGAKTE